jgi:hypothetical protein
MLRKIEKGDQATAVIRENVAGMDVALFRCDGSAVISQKHDTANQAYDLD